MTTIGALRRQGRALVGHWQRTRRRYEWLDHLARAGAQLAGCHADRLAAALSYYAFFAVFALTGVGFAALGWLFHDDVAAIAAAQRWVDQTLPGIDVAALADASGKIGVIALAALLVAGLSWVNEFRSAVRTVWGFEAHPGKLLVRLAVDALVLAALGILLMVSVGTAVGVTAAVRWLVVDAAGAEGTPMRSLIAVSGFLIGLVVNTVLAMALLSGLPRIRLGVRRLIGPALLIAVGLELLKTVGRLYFERSMANPAYQAVAGAVGLLLFLYVINYVVLYAAALTATSRHGTATDLAVWTVARASSEVDADAHDADADTDVATAAGVIDSARDIRADADADDAGVRVATQRDGTDDKADDRAGGGTGDVAHEGSGDRAGDGADDRARDAADGDDGRRGGDSSDTAATVERPPTVVGRRPVGVTRPPAPRVGRGS